MNRQSLFVGVAAALVLSSSALSHARSPDSQALLGQAPPADATEISQLVRQLGSPSYRLRETATRSLMKIGVPAKGALLSALEDSDAEVRYRARLVLADVLEVDFRHRLDAFIDDIGGTSEHDLPCWSRFRARLGDDAASRRLFADMQREESSLLEAAEQGPEHASAAFDARCQQIQESLRVPGRSSERQVSLGTVATLLFIGADDDVPLSVQSAMYVTNFCYQQPFRRATSGGDSSTLLRKLVGGWVQRDFGSDSSAAHQTMMLALQFNVREGTEPALAILKEGNGNAQMRQFAILVVGKFGTPAEIGRLEALLSDKSVCAQQQVARPADAAAGAPAKSEVIETQIRDVALAAMIHLSGQKVADFGFQRAQPNGTFLFNTASLGFSQESDREAALAKWHAWRSEHTSTK